MRTLFASVFVERAVYVHLHRLSDRRVPSVSKLRPSNTVQFSTAKSALTVSFDIPPLGVVAVQLSLARHPQSRACGRWCIAQGIDEGSFVAAPQ